MRKLSIVLLTVIALASCTNNGAGEVIESTQVDSVAVDSLTVNSVEGDTTVVDSAVAE